MRKILLLLIMILLVFGCASKRYAKKAKELEKAGLYVESAEMYYKSAKANKNNVDAKIGLRKNGQMALDNKIAKFKKEYTNRNIQDAIYSFKDVLVYHKKIKTVGIDLDIPTSSRQYYKEVKSVYLESLYAKAVSANNKEDFFEALKLFEEINSFDSNYKDVNSQILIARYEPVYRKAYDALNLGKYRAAYYDFDKVLRGTKGNYKEADILKNEAREKATIVITVIPFQTSYSSRGRINNFFNKLIVKVNSIDSPFIVYKDYNTSGVNINSSRGVNFKALRASGIKAVVLGKVVNYREYNGRLSAEKKPAYIVHTRKVKSTDGKEKTEKYYTKDIYTEFSKLNKIAISVNYQIFSTETGDIITADNFEKEVVDKVVYAEFKGPIKNIVPGYWKSIRIDSKEDRVYDDYSSRKKLQKLFRSRKNIKSIQRISDDLQNEVALSIANKIKNYNPES
ncbi:MAG: hypothetical protein WBG43_02510 [Marinifilaceae bacterium]